MTTSNKQTRSQRLKFMTLISMFMAIELVMWLLHLGQVPFGPLNMSLLTVPVAIGAILLGPVAGLILGATFGLTSLYDAITGASVLTGYFFSVQPVHTVFLCVGMRILMGLFTGLIFKALKSLDRTRIVSFYVGAISAPLLNTFFFMGYIVLFLYQTEKVQSIAATLGAANPFMFVVLLVGVQGLIEAAVCCLIAGSVAKAVSHALHLQAPQESAPQKTKA